MLNTATNLPVTACETVTGKAVVTAAVPEAAQAGLDILRRGGNAFDAAVAACLVESVALPMKLGLAGDLVALVHVKGSLPRALLSIGGGPEALAKGAKLQVTGACSVGIPGAPQGYMEIARLGRLSMDVLAAPAIRLANAGAKWSPIAVKLTQETETLLRKNNGEIRFLPGGKLPKVGERFQLPGLARVIEEFVAKGADLFDGKLGDAMLAKIESGGGFLTREDLKSRPAKWFDLEAQDLGNDCTLMATPYPTHGRFLLSAAKLVSEGHDVQEAHHVATNRLPTDVSGTSVITCADEEGNLVVLVPSNSFPQYGSAVVMEDDDLVLSNRPGRGFDLNAAPGAPNAPAAGNVPQTTLHAWLLETPDGVFAGASPGGQNQMPWNLQTVSGLLDGDRDLADLINRPRWGLRPNKEIEVEEGHSMASGGSFEVIPHLSLRSVNQIISKPHGSDQISAAADPRTGAKALAKT